MTDFNIGRTIRLVSISLLTTLFGANALVAEEVCPCFTAEDLVQSYCVMGDHKINWFDSLKGERVVVVIWKCDSYEARLVHPRTQGVETNSCVSGSDFSRTYSRNAGPDVYACFGLLDAHSKRR